MIRRIVGLCFGWLILSGGWLLPSAASAASCAGRPEELVISAPTTLDSLSLSGQRVRIAAPLTIAGPLEGCAASLELLPGASLTAASIDLTARQATLDRGSLHSAGRLRLHSQRLIVRDGPGQPLLIAGDGAVELTGADALDLRAVGDRFSMIRAGGDLVLRSGRPIRGDAHYLAGGAVRMEALDGAPAAVFSPDDPIVLARFDVSLGNFSGASLHVLAGGRVTLGDVTINAADTQANSINPGNTTLFNPTTRIQDLAPVQLSTAEVITVAGNLRPTLDVRAGIDWASLGGLGANQVIPGGSVAPTFGGSSTSAAIVAGVISVTQPSGFVLLTNQYRPRAGLSGDITTGSISATSAAVASVKGGDIWIDSRGGVTTGYLQTIAIAAGGSGGPIWVRAAAGSIATGSQESYAISSGDTGSGGPITIAAPAGAVQINGPINTSSSSSSGRAGSGGALSIDAGGAITGKPQIYTNSFGPAGSASGGAINLASTGRMDLDAILSYSRYAQAGSTGSGPAGAITLLARNAGAANGGDDIAVSLIYADSGGYTANSAATGASAGGGAVSMRSEDGPIAVANWIWAPSVARGGANHAGNGGSVSLTAGNGGISVGNFGIGAFSQVIGGSGNAGRGGNVSLVASGPITVNPAGVSGGINTSSNASGNTFGGGNVLLITNQGAVSLGDNYIDTRASSNAASAGNAGNVTVMAGPGSGGSIKFNASLSDSSASAPGSNSGNGGRISLHGGPILIKDSLSARSQASQGFAGSGGDVIITSATTATLNNIQTQVDSLNGSGDGGDITIEVTGRLKVNQIFASTRFSGSGYAGDAGDTRITVHNSGALDGADDLELAWVWSDAGTWYYDSARGPSGDGGDSILVVEDGDALIGQWLWGQSHARGATFASEDGGEVRVQASGQIRFGDFGINTISQSVNGAAGRAGAVSLEAGGDITNITTIAFPAITAGASGRGGAGGPISITSAGSINFGSLGIFSTATSSIGTSGDGGPISISAGTQATATISTGAILSHSQGGQNSGHGGAISIVGGRVSTGSIQSSTQATAGLSGDGGAISVTADTFPAANIDLQSYSQGSAGSGVAGSIELTAGGPLALRNIYAYSHSSTSGSSGDGGAISIRSLNRAGLDGGDAVAIYFLISDSGATFSSTSQAITAGAAGAVRVEAADGPISIVQPVYASAMGRNGAGAAGAGGAVTLLAPRGSISLGGSLAILTSSEASNSSGAAGQGGPISIQAGGDLLLPGNGAVSSASIATTGAAAGGGAISIDVQGAITAAASTFQSVSRTTSGAVGPAGDLSLRAGGPIQVATLRAFSTRSSGQIGAAGDILVETPAGLTASSIDASASGIQPGPAGTVEIRAGQMVRLTGITSGASVVASGLPATGAISITHGGAGVTPFIVGDPASNGSAGALRTGAAAINPTRSFLYSYTEAPNIHIISVPPPALGLGKTVAPDSPLAYHGALTYTLTLSNTGSAAAGVMLTDTLPLGLAFDHWVSQPAGGGVSGNTVTWSGALAQNATLSLSFVAVHTGSAGQTLTNTAQISHAASFFGASASVAVTVEPALSAQAGPDQSADEGQPVQFSGAASSPPAASSWDFGDGGVVSGALSASHAYQDNGVYTATLTVTSTSGLVASDTLVVSVGNVAPQAQAGPDQTVEATPGGTLVSFSGGFSDPGALDTVSLSWDFGDGQTGSGATPSHTYAAPGVYTVTLTATDDDGGQSSDTLSVTISAEPAAQSKIYLPRLIK